MFINLKDTRYMQYVGALAATMSMSAAAMYTTWPSPSLPLLKGEDTPLNVPMTTDEGSWMVSLFLLIAVPLTPLTTMIVEKWGTKFTLMLCSVFLFAPWILTMFATTVWMLYIARMVGGFGMTLATAGSAIYTGEIADPDIRGKLGTFISMMKLLGSFIVLCAGPFVSFVALACICASVPFTFLVIFCFMPESPYYLIKRGRREEAIASLTRFARNGTQPDVIEKRVAEIESIVHSDMEKKMGMWQFFIGKEYRRHLFIITGVKTLHQMSGVLAIEAYLQTIIAATGSSISPEISSIIFGSIQFPAAFVSSILVDKLGRKPLLITSALGCAVALISEGVYFFLQDYMQTDVSNISWLPTTSIVVFLVMSTLGILNLPYVLMGELFPTNVKGTAVNYATCYGSLLAAIVSKLFEPVRGAWGAYTAFWIFAGFCIAGALFALFFLPETKGKTFAEIQEKLGRHLKIKDVELDENKNSAEIKAKCDEKV